MNVNIPAVIALFDKQKISSGVDQNTLPQQQVINSANPDDIHALACEMAKTESGLWGGNWEGHYSRSSALNSLLPSYNSHSEADMALTTKIAIEAYRMGVPIEILPATVEAVFGQSKLAQRDKWQNRADYREGTIQKAVESALSIQADAGLKSIENKQGTTPNLLTISDGKLKLSKGDPQPRDWVLELILLAC